MKKLITSDKYQFRVNYFADSNGHIWSENKKDYLREYEDKNGYKKVVLMTTDKPSGKGRRFSVHRLILSTFQPNVFSYTLTVDHIDGDITNNALTNLKWATIKENLDNPTTKPNRRCYDQEGTHNANSIFSLDKLLLLIKDVNSGSYKRQDILKKYNICDETLRSIINKKTYKKELENIIILPNFISDYARETKGEANGRAKLNNEQVLEIIKLIQSNKYSYKEIAQIYNVSASAISNIKNKNTWTHLTKNITF